MPDVRPAIASDRPELINLIREMIPGVDAEARWRWLYDRNPGGPALTWMAEKSGEVTGCTSFFPFRLWLDGAEVKTALGGDGYVRPAFRRGGVGFALHDASRNAMATQQIGCMYGAPGAMNLTPLKHGGSRELGQVARWVRPIRAAALGNCAGVLGDLPLAVPPGRSVLEPMQPNDPRVDRVWARGARVPAAVSRPRCRVLYLAVPVGAGRAPSRRSSSRGAAYRSAPAPTS